MGEGQGAQTFSTAQRRRDFSSLLCHLTVFKAFSELFPSQVQGLSSRTAAPKHSPHGSG